MKVKNLKKGEILSETQFYTVDEIKGNQINLRTDKGDIITVNDSYAESQLKSAEQFDKVEKVSRTELTNIFMNSSNRAITVCFNKQIKSAEVKETLYELYANKGGKLVSEADFKTTVDELLSSVITGKERVIKGRHYGAITEHGRVNFIDMELEKDGEKSYETRFRQVDTRTLQFLIVDGVKYEVK